MTPPTSSILVLSKANQPSLLGMLHATENAVKFSVRNPGVTIVNTRGKIHPTKETPRRIMRDGGGGGQTSVRH